MGKEKKKSGLPDHFSGFKYNFLAGYSGQSQVVVDTKKMTNFMTLSH